MRVSPYEDGPFEYDEAPFREKIAPPTDDEALQEIGERSRHIIQQVTDAMHLGSVEVAITYDNRIDVKEVTIRGLLLPLSPDWEEEVKKRREERFRKLLDQLKQG